MRDILFRGKRKDNGEWVYGAYITMHHNDERTHLHHFIIPDNSDLSFGVKVEGILVEVIPETVGQYTGMKDKNSKEIFEGDIVRYANCVHKVVFESRNGSGYFGIVISEIETHPFNNMVPAELMEVIGNIHDNPELLETAKKFWR